MYSVTFLFLASIGLSFLFTPVVRNGCRLIGVVDPPGRRKIHPRPVPRVGGIAIALAYVCAYALLLVSPLKGGHFFGQHLPLVWKLVPAASLVFVIGLLDDLVGLTPWQKLLGQSVAAVWACWSGVRILNIADRPTEAWWALPLTVLWLVGCTNAFNLIDGIDGLAAGVGLLATLTTFVAAMLMNQPSLALATVALAGCLMGFLPYNFNPASIFLGDCGSLLIGFLLGCYGVLWSQKCATLLAVTAPVMALSIPLLDVALSIVRRYLRHQPIFRADRGHIHHRLMDRGLTPRRAVLVIYGVCGVAAALSLLQIAMRNRFAGLVIVLFCAGAWLGIHNLGYAEFGMAKSMLTESAFRRTLDARMRLRSLEERLLAAATAEDCWPVVRDASRDFGFHEVRMRLAGKTFHETFGPAVPWQCWELRISLSESAYITLSCESFSGILQTIVAPFADTLLTTLRLRLPCFEPWARTASLESSHRLELTMGASES
jgi:UDP-GlcNAc:undecaprenyl-phosphate GlcNAc-1-phosphate transferase